MVVKRPNRPGWCIVLGFIIAGCVMTCYDNCKLLTTARYNPTLAGYEPLMIVNHLLFLLVVSGSEGLVIVDR